jgi:hypothetical protein
MQNKNLIWLLAFLLALRFVVVPWLEWQDEQFVRLQTLAKRLDRSEALLTAKEQVISQAAQADSVADELMQGLAVVPAAAEYKISFQQQLQQQLESAQVQLLLFEWNSDRSLSVFDLQRGRINLRLKGTYPNLLKVHAQLEQGFPGIQIRELRAGWSEALRASSEIELQLVVDLDYRVAP